MQERVRTLNRAPIREKAHYVLYWTQMNRRAESNFALNFAAGLANERDLPLLVYEGLTYTYKEANDRIHTFMLQAVPETARRMTRLGAGYCFYLRRKSSDPNDVLYRLAHNTAAVVTDDYPTFIAAQHNLSVPNKIGVAFYAVDSSCIVPMNRHEKREYGAYTIRPRIHRLLPEYLKPAPEVKLKRRWNSPLFPWHTPYHTDVTPQNIADLVASCAIDHRVPPSISYDGGRTQAEKNLEHFLEQNLRRYARDRNEPSRHATSELSPYLHFGHISSLEVALAAREHARRHNLIADEFLEELINFVGTRTRLVMGTRDFIQFYHRRMNLTWDFTRAYHESEIFDADHGTRGDGEDPDVSHARVRRSFAEARGLEPYRRVPGVFSLGFGRCHRPERARLYGVRERLSHRLPLQRSEVGAGRACTRRSSRSDHVGSFVPPNEEETVSVIRMRDGEVRRMRERADAKGRLRFELDGDEYEVGIGSGPVLALTGFKIEGAPWATDTRPVHVRISFLNKGNRTLSAAQPHWGTSNPGVQLDPVNEALPSLGPGKSTEVPLTFTVLDATREIVRLFADVGRLRLAAEISTYPPADDETNDFKIADGLSLPVYQRAVQKQMLTLGTGNGNGQVNAGERIAVLLPDGDAYRAAELFTNDACVDLTKRVSDEWGGYDHVGASAKYSLPLIVFVYRVKPQ